MEEMKTVADLLKHTGKVVKVTYNGSPDERYALIGQNDNPEKCSLAYEKMDEMSGHVQLLGDGTITRMGYSFVLADDKEIHDKRFS